MQYNFLEDPNHLALDTNDKIISIGKNRLEELGIKSSDLVIGMSLFEILRNVGGAPDIFIQQKEEVKQKVLGGVIDETWLLISNRFAHNQELHLTHIKALCNAEKIPVGCIITPRKFTLHGQNEVAKLPATPKLSIRQQEVIFLLAIGVMQKEIAQLYAVQRGTIIKSIGAICEKFNIHGANENKLIQLAYECGYGVPPYHLLNIGIFQFSTPFISNYHLRKLLLSVNE